MAFCANCGAQLEDGARFCTMCGTAFPVAGSGIQNSTDKNFKSVIFSFTKEDSVFAYLFAGLFVCQVGILLFSFAGLVDFPIGGHRTIYELDDQRTWVFLILSLVEIILLLNKAEIAFVPMRVVNYILITNILDGQIAQVIGTNNNLLLINAGKRVFVGKTVNLLSFGLFSTWEIAASMDGPSAIKVLPSYGAIQFLSSLSIVLMCAYLFFRIFRKRKIHPAAMVERLSLSGFLDAVTSDKILTLASVLLVVAPFLPFRGGRTAFFVRPYCAFLIVAVGFLLFCTLQKAGNRIKWILLAAALVSFMVWNPIYIMRNGGMGAGYFIYIAGLILLAVRLILLPQT